MSAEEIYQRAFDARYNGDYGTARSLLEQVLGGNPNHADALWQLGLVQQFGDGDFDGSAETLKKVVVLNPNHIDARYDLGMTYMMLGMMDEACAEMREILRQNPGHEKAAQQAIYCD